MKIIVRPSFERSRTFKHLVPAMLFAEAARRRQGPITPAKRGGVEVHIFDGYSSHVVAHYGVIRQVIGNDATAAYGWTWRYAKR